MTKSGKAVFLSPAERQLLEELAREAGYAPGPVADLVERLVNAEQSVMGMGRRHGIFERIKSYIEEAFPLATAGRGKEGK